VEPVLSTGNEIKSHEFKDVEFEISAYKTEELNNCNETGDKLGGGLKG
jgi:hypothetical protein